MTHNALVLRNYNDLGDFADNALFLRLDESWGDFDLGLQTHLGYTSGVLCWASGASYHVGVLDTPEVMQDPTETYPMRSAFCEVVLNNPLAEGYRVPALSLEVVVVRTDLQPFSLEEETWFASLYDHELSSLKM